MRNIWWIWYHICYINSICNMLYLIQYMSGNLTHICWITNIYVSPYMSYFIQYMLNVLYIIYVTISTLYVTLIYVGFDLLYVIYNRSYVSNMHHICRPVYVKNRTVYVEYLIQNMSKNNHICYIYIQHMWTNIYDTKSTYIVYQYMLIMLIIYVLHV